MTPQAEADFNKSMTNILVAVATCREPQPKREPAFMWHTEWTGSTDFRSMKMTPTIPPAKGTNWTDAIDARGELIRQKLDQLAVAPVRELNGLFDSIISLNRPDLVGTIAAERFNATHNIAFLDRAASVLDNFGLAAWDALNDLARNHTTIISPFVRVIADCEGVSEDSRAATLVALAGYCDGEGLDRIFELSSSFSSDNRRRILSAISARNIESEATQDARLELDGMTA